MRFLCPARPGSLAFLCDDGESFRQPKHSHGTDMLDIIFVAAGLAFFAVGVAYTLLCDRL
jgi:hypothetical protein